MHMQILLTYWDRDFLRDDLVTVTKQRLIEIVTGLLTIQDFDTLVIFSAKLTAEIEFLYMCRQMFWNS